MTALASQAEVDNSRAARIVARVVGWGTVGTVVALMVSLIAAMTGNHRAIWIVPFVLGITVWLAPRLPSRLVGPGPAVSWVVFGALVLVIAASVSSNAVYHSEHMLTGRDGGTYTTTARFLVDGLDLFPQAARGPVDASQLSLDAPGFELRPDGTYAQQFLHSSSALYAVIGELIGVSAIHSINAVVGGLALTALFALARRFVTPCWALLATVLVAASLPFVYLARSAMSETLALLLAVAGGWLLVHALTDAGSGAYAGAALGGAALVRVDGWLLGVGLAAGLLWLALSPGSRGWRTVRDSLLAFCAVAALGVVDLAGFSQPYLRDLGVRFWGLIALTVVLVGAAHVLQGKPIASVQNLLSRPSAAATAVAIVFALAVYMLAIRPSLVAAVGDPYGLAEIQLREGLPHQPTRTYAELSARWIAWYFGWITLAAGLAGTLAAIYAAATRPRAAALKVTLSLFFVTTAVFLFRPSINPDHIWASRRFLPVVFPGVAILAVWFAQVLWRRMGLRGSSSYMAAVLFGAVLILSVLTPTRPLWSTAELRGSASLLLDLCDRIPQNTAVVFIDRRDDTALFPRLGPPLMAWCDIPAAAVPAPVTNQARERLAQDAREQGSDVLFLSAHPSELGRGSELLHEIAARGWLRTLAGPPRASGIYRTEIWAGGR